MLTLNDGRAELWQWDTGRTLAVDADCSQVHFSNKVFGRSIDVDVADGVAIIPDILLQTDKDLNVWAFAGTSENGYTKISKTFKVNRRNKPADYVFTPPEQTTLAELVGRLDRIEESQDPDAIKNAVDAYFQQNPVEAPVQSVNGKTGTVALTAEDVGAISQDDLQNSTNEALAQAKASGEFDGAKGDAGVGIQSVEQTTTSTEDGGTNVVTVTRTDGTTSTFQVKNGSRGQDATVDATLTQSGQAADAAVVGQKIGELSEEIRNQPGGGGLSQNAKSLLITILRNATFEIDQTANITALETALSGSTEPEHPESGIVQIGSVLAITSGVTAIQTGSMLAVA